MSNVIDPIKLLTDKGERQPAFMNSIFNPVVCSVLGFGCAIFLNFGLRKPPFSGIQNHVAFAAIGGGLGLYFDNKRNEHLAKRDAVLRHYIELHPDDFPVKERKKYADVLEAWVPIR
ncbi:NADH dehydrogenase [ubiquinone] 1 subunit C2 [Bactrocera neohumeralis]|uniref:NADH dehydrogenase [ubiquinone] 1 subunit C2 n=1 Tax=Bactrocera tryoni TaxID=59916 RepID=UPI001A962308|nr:NADH dehydrogenase [ubiquinone] 1 subunit C2 [Bactrocera tryoni]XP_050321570.1 NADH dehydrogenase [ubiquinone] 1 subunit C2 [Bactrocera neohumeralis]